MLLEPITVYFSIPPGKLDSYAPVIRLFMGTLIKHFSGYNMRGHYPVAKGWKGRNQLVDRQDVFAIHEQTLSLG